MLRVRDIHSTDRDGRNIDRFADEFKAIFSEFGHEINHAYIDYAWESGMKLEQAAWNAISADREMELYVFDDYTYEFIDRLRRAKPETIGKNPEHLHPDTQKLRAEPPKRVLRTRGWPVQTPPRRGYYCAENGQHWYLLVNIGKQHEVFWFALSFVKTTAASRSVWSLHLPVTMESAEDWRQRCEQQGLLYRGAFWACRDDMVSYPSFRDYGLVMDPVSDIDDSEGNTSEWLL